MYRNGAVSFGGEIDSGAPYIKGFFAETNTSTGFNVEFFLEDGHDDCKTDMFEERNHTLDLLGADFAADFEVKYMFALTWNNKAYCGKDEVSKQKRAFSVIT